jgi:hypothetical protein
MNDKNEFKEDKDKLDIAKSSFLKIIDSLDNSEQIKQFNEFVKNILGTKKIFFFYFIKLNKSVGCFFRLRSE